MHDQSSYLTDTTREIKLKQLIWSDEIQQKLEKQDLMFMNRLNGKKLIIKNKIIIDYTTEYIKR